MLRVSITINGVATKITPNKEFLTEAPKSARKKWHDALVSGKYENGKEVLYNAGQNTYCCLGVGSLGYVKRRTIKYVDLPSLKSKFANALNCATYDKKEDDDGYDPVIGQMIKNGRNGRKYTAAELNDNSFDKNLFAKIAKLIYPEAYQKESK